MSDRVTVSREDHLAIISLSHPDRLNVLDRQGWEALADNTSLFEAGVTQSFWQAAMTLATGVSPGPLGSAHPLTAPYQAFETSDGWITVGGSNQATWHRLIETVGLPELADDPRFLENADRMRNVGALASVLGERFKTRPTAEWLGLLEEGGVPAGPVASIGEMLELPQTLARDMVVEVEHSKLGPVRTVGFPVKFSKTPTSIERGAPLLGEHTPEVLAEVGYADEEIEELKRSGAVRAYHFVDDGGGVVDGGGRQAGARRARNRTTETGFKPRSPAGDALLSAPSGIVAHRGATSSASKWCRLPGVRAPAPAKHAPGGRAPPPCPPTLRG